MSNNDENIDIEKSNTETSANKKKGISIKATIGILVALFCIVLIFIVFTKTCLISHNWQEATCKTAKTCSKCGITEGESLGHKWIEATCESPKICSKCNEKEGKSLGHQWIEATCEKAKTCSKCNKTEGISLGHKWIEATCKSPKTCSVCKKTTGKPLTTHTVSNWNIVKATTCTAKGSKEGICSVCKNKVTEVIDELSHNFVDNKTTKFASEYSTGEKSLKCTNCGNTISVSYNLSAQEKSNINTVKNGILNNYPSKTIDTAFTKFFSNPIWYADGNEVAFSGGCTWNGNATTAYIGFIIDGTSFKIDGIEVDNKRFAGNSLGAINILNTIYGY